MEEQIRSDFSLEPKPGIIDGNAIVTQMKEARAALPEHYGMIRNNTTGETVETTGDGVENSKPRKEDEIFTLRQQIRDSIDESNAYLDENGMDFEKSKYNGARYGKLGAKELKKELQRLQENKDHMIELNEYNPTDDDLAEAEEEMVTDDIDYEEFSSKYPSLKDSKYPSPEDMDKMSDEEITRWFGYDS